MNMRLGDTEYNFRTAEELIKNELEQNEDTDVIVLPETWNTGFFPRTDLASLCDKEGERTKKLMSSLAAKYSVNIVAGSVADIHADGKIYNSAYIFDRNGNCIASYDKTHLFTPMGEHNFFEKGDHLCRFTLDGVSCAIIICYDIRFPELTGTLALGEGGLDVLFIVACVVLIDSGLVNGGIALVSLSGDNNVLTAILSSLAHFSANESHRHKALVKFCLYLKLHI